MLDLVGQLKLPLQFQTPVKIQNVRNEFIYILCNDKIHVITLSFENLNECGNPRFPVDKSSTSNDIRENVKIFLKTKVCYILPSLVCNVTIANSTLYILTSQGIAVQPLNEEEAEEEDTSSDDIFETAETTKHNYDIIKEIREIRYKKYGIQALASVPDVLVICSKDLIHDVWLVELLYQGILYSSKRENVLFTTAYDRHNFEEDCKNRQLELDPFENQMPSQNYEPVLLCIAARKPETFYSSMHTLKKELFISLFAEPNSLNNVIVLLALSDGKVVWYPMKQNFSSDKCSAPYLLCDLSQPVIAMFCTNLKSTEECADSITIIGSEGKIVVFSNIKDKSGYHTLFGQLESSLHSCIMWKNFVVYISSNRQLYGCEISLTENVEHSLKCHCYRLPVSGACAICFVEKDNDIKIMCLSLTGYLYTLPFCNFASDDSISDSSDFQTVLKSISDNAKELSYQQSFIKLQKQVLSQLGIALDLKFKTQIVENLPYFMEKVKGQEDTYALIIDYTALNKLDLHTEWWNFVVTVKSKYHISFCKSIPFGSNSTTCITLKICQNKSSSSLCPPLSVEYGLQFQFSSVKQEFLEYVKKLNPIYVCIHHDTIDELCFLTIEKGDHNTCTISQKISSIHEERKRQYFLKTNIQKGIDISHPSEMWNSILFSIHRIQPPVNKNKSNEGTVEPQDILAYLAQKSLLSNFQIISNHLICYYFDVRVRIEVQNKEEYMQVSIHSDEQSVVCKLRKAILFRIKDLLNSEELQSQEISLSKICLVRSQSLYSELCSMASAGDLTMGNLVGMYEKIRKDISQHLPII